MDCHRSSFSHGNPFYDHKRPADHTFNKIQQQQQENYQLSLRLMLNYPLTLFTLFIPGADPVKGISFFFGKKHNQQAQYRLIGNCKGHETFISNQIPSHPKIDHRDKQENITVSYLAIYKQMTICTGTTGKNPNILTGENIYKQRTLHKFANGRALIAQK